MALLKEDGSLDVERINQLPLDEWMDEIAGLTREQYEEYDSKTPLNESENPVRSVMVDYPMEDKRNGVDAVVFLNGQKKKYGIQ